ncbi:MAG: histidine kinase [Flavobacteriales bacterium]|nr:MAG: histidine kinase [Flavobacteriales bacterium]
MKTLLLVLALGAATPHSKASQVPVLVQEGGSGRSPIGLSMELLEDPDGTLTAAEVIRSNGFVAASSEAPNLGLTGSTYWARFTVVNKTQGNDLLVEVSNAETEHIEMFAFKGGQLFANMTTGQLLEVDQRPVTDVHFLMPLPLEPNDKCVVLLRVRSSKQLQIPVRITTRADLPAQRVSQTQLVGTYTGVMLVLVIYNLFIYFSSRDRSYMFYVIYLALVALTQLTFLGVGQFSFWPGNVWFASKASIIFTIATAWAASEFMRAFILTKDVVPRLDRYIPWFYWLFVVCLGVYISGYGQIGYALAQVCAGLFAPFMFYTAFRVWRRGSRQAGYFLIAWSVFLSGTMVFVLKDAGILPYNDITIYTMPLGSAIEGILLSFGLADRINVLRKEKERSQAAALAASLENERIIRDQNAILEQKVTERTHELVEANNEIKRTQVQLVEAEKMAGLGQLTAGIAHEINNPINFINSNIPPLRRNLQDMTEVIRGYRSGQEDPAARLAEADKLYNELGIDDALAELDGMIGSIDEGARRTAEIVKGLRNFSRLDEDALKLADLNEGVQSTLALLSPQVRGQVTFNTVLAELPQAECLPGKLNQAIMNLLTNAAQSVRAKHGETGQGLVSIRTWHEDGRITIAVKDNGVGMTEEVKARMFEPFFTTKGVGEGTGLGLSITYSIVQKHFGQIAVESAPGEGAEFRITVPVRQENADNIALRA